MIIFTVQLSWCARYLLVIFFLIYIDVASIREELIKIRAVPWDSTSSF